VALTGGHYLRSPARQPNCLEFPVHLAFSPDVSPSDFFIFAELKGQLSDHTFESAYELVEEMTSAIQRARLETVFLDWEQRLQRCININGSHVD
jgi:hypothetical protein